jgi:prevent-host-death family protein
MRSVSAREANQQFARILGEAASGEEIVITRRGKAVAVLAPLSAGTAYGRTEGRDRATGRDDAPGDRQGRPPVQP